jgi:hypothetical protein
MAIQTYLGPAITFALIDFIVPLALAVEIGFGGSALLLGALREVAELLAR